MRRCFRRRRIIIFRRGLSCGCFCFNPLDRLGLLYRFALNRLTLRYLCGSFKRCTVSGALLSLLSEEETLSVLSASAAASVSVTSSLSSFRVEAVETSEQPLSSIISTRSAANIHFLIISTSFTASLYEKKPMSSKVQTDLRDIADILFSDSLGSSSGGEVWRGGIANAGIHANRQTSPSVCGYLSCALFRCRCRL